MTRVVILCILLASCGACATQPRPHGEAAAQIPRNDPFRRLALRPIRRGVNLAHWFAQAPATPRVLNETFTDEDFDDIAGSGFDFVRLPVDPEFLYSMGSLVPGRCDRIAGVVRRLLDRGLAVIVDLHPREDWVAGMATDPVRTDHYIRMVGDAAEWLAVFPPESVGFECLNEPTGFSAAAWNILQKRIHRAARSAMPRHTLVLTGARWSTIAGLLECEPVPDRNIIYTFHFYEPEAFTFQGAVWGPSFRRHLQGIPYPFQRDLADRARRDSLESVGDGAGRRDVIQTFVEFESAGVDRAVLEASIRRAAEFAEKFQIPIWCGEFGVYKKTAPASSRAAWLRDVRQLLESKGIPWSVWEYHAGFGIKEYRGAPDAGIWDALGLNGP